METLKSLSEKTNYNVIAANSPSSECYHLLIFNENKGYGLSYYINGQPMGITLRKQGNLFYKKRMPKFLSEIL